MDRNTETPDSNVPTDTGGNTHWESHYTDTVPDRNPEDFREINESLPYVRRLISLAEQSTKSLEFGSGLGGLSLATKLRYPDLETHLLDYSQAAVDFSGSLYQYFGVDGCFHHGSVTSTDFKDGYFDLVHSNTVLEHIPDPEKAMREVNRITRPGTKLLITVPNRYRRWDGHDLYHYINDLKYYSSPFTIRELATLVEASGFEIEDKFGVTSLYCYPSYALRLAKRLVSSTSGDSLNQPELQIEQSASSPIEPTPPTLRRTIDMALRSLDRLWGRGQATVDGFLTTRELIPANLAITIGIVARRL